jgi:hypothetical protein
LCISSEEEEGEEEEGRRRRRRRRRRSLLRIIHARGAIPNEMGPTRCRATPALRRRRRSLFRRRWRSKPLY